MFQGRLDGIDLRTSFAPACPPCNLDREQFKRVVVNLVDNAAEAMQDSLVKQLLHRTQHGRRGYRGTGDRRYRLRHLAGRQGEAVPAYFSTKGRGTGLGLAIVATSSVRARRAHPRRGQPAGRRPLHRGDPGQSDEPADPDRPDGAVHA